MTPTIEKISAITVRVLNMKDSVQFYRNVLGVELPYGGEQSSFSSLRANNSESAILNLERGGTASGWGRLIFHVTDVNAFWTHLKERGFNILKSHGTRLGVNATSTCSIRMATNCRLLSRCNELAKRMRPDELFMAVAVDQRGLLRLCLSNGQTAPYCLLLRSESPCRLEQLNLAIETASWCFTCPRTGLDI